MKATVNKNAFIEAFKKSDEYNNQFSPEALNLIFDYLEEIDENVERPQGSRRVSHRHRLGRWAGHSPG